MNEVAFTKFSNRSRLFHSSGWKQFFIQQCNARIITAVTYVTIRFLTLSLASGTRAYDSREWATTPCATDVKLIIINIIIIIISSFTFIFITIIIAPDLYERLTHTVTSWRLQLPAVKQPSLCAPIRNFKLTETVQRRATKLICKKSTDLTYRDRLYYLHLLPPN